MHLTFHKLAALSGCALLAHLTICESLLRMPVNLRGVAQPGSALGFGPKVGGSNPLAPTNRIILRLPHWRPYPICGQLVDKLIGRTLC